jgi:hypothetical protein
MFKLYTHTAVMDAMQEYKVSVVRSSVNTYIHTCIHACIHSDVHSYIHTTVMDAMQEYKVRWHIHIGDMKLTTQLVRIGVDVKQHTHAHAISTNSLLVLADVDSMIITI